MMKKTLLLLSLCLTGCVSPKAIRVDLPGPDPSAAVSVNDLRPASEKEGKIFSLLITSNGYGIYRRGDNLLDPSAIQLFRRLAYETLGDTVAMSPVTVHHFVVYENAKVALRQSAAVAMGVALGGVAGGSLAGGAPRPLSSVPPIFSQSVPDRGEFENYDHEYERAYCKPSEIPGCVPAYIVYIDATIGDKRVLVKAVSPTGVVDGKNGYSQAVQLAIRYWLTEYAAS